MLPHLNFFLLLIKDASNIFLSLGDSFFLPLMSRWLKVVQCAVFLNIKL